MTHTSLAPRHVLVTGGSQGIGLGLARRFAARGDAVLITGRSADRLDHATRHHRGLQTYVNDITTPAGRERLAEHVQETMPEVDTVINNAGIQRRVPLADDDATWPQRQAEIDILLAAPIHLNHLLIPTLLEHERPSLIVNVTSGGALVPQPFAPIYSACKAALHSYTLNLRFALANTRCRVQELIPPAVATALAGAKDAHGAPVDDFCDAVFPQLDGSVPEIGYGITATPLFQDQLAAARSTFDDLSNRVPVATYQNGHPHDAKTRGGWQ